MLLLRLSGFNDNAIFNQKKKRKKQKNPTKIIVG